MENNKNGFTILEIMVSVSLFVFVIILSGSIYSLSQRSYNQGEDQGELVQNARVSLDRMTRELRQSVNIVTVLPEIADDPVNPPVAEIFFQDGHDISQITYLRYHLDGSDLKRSHLAYYFPAEPDIYVVYDSVDPLENPPAEIVIADQIVGEYFSKLEFWGSNGLVHVSLGLIKGQNILNIDTSIFARN